MRRTEGESIIVCCVMFTFPVCDQTHVIKCPLNSKRYISDEQINDEKGLARDWTAVKVCHFFTHGKERRTLTTLQPSPLIVLNHILHTSLSCTPLSKANCTRPIAVSCDSEFRLYFVLKKKVEYKIHTS